MVKNVGIIRAVTKKEGTDRAYVGVVEILEGKLPKGAKIDFTASHFRNYPGLERDDIVEGTLETTEGRTEIFKVKRRIKWER